MMRLAGEYLMAFGRASLDQRLMQLVPDLSFEPGPLHELLLRLRWRDVFTTNWDSLLERTRPRILDYTYQVVAAPADISRSIQPRIVKLHGSFPHTRPFIVTEDDYRTYPEKFASFVNMVRQGSMENILCLIGFSGDDPNFLAWMGWVRDQLRQHQPYIYLASRKSYSNPQRQLLESRSVRLIELNRIPGLDRMPKARQHAAALEWFLKNLGAGRSSSTPTHWPDPRPSTGPKGPSGLPDIPPAPSPGFAPEPDVVEQSKQTVDWLVDTILAWRANRLTYPDWVVAPHAVRERLWYKTVYLLDPMLKLLQGTSLLMRLLVCRECVFRLDVCAVSLPDNLAEFLDRLLENILESIRGQNDMSTITATDVGFALSVSDDNTHEARLWIDASETASAWLHVMFSLLRWARETGDTTSFEKLVRPIEASRATYADVWPRLCYERCLLALSQLDQTAFELAITAWADADGGDLFWRVRRASLLAETGRIAEGESLAGTALDEIKRVRRTDIVDVAALSREAWTVMILSALKASHISKNWEAFSQLRIEWHRRLAEITYLVGNPYDELERLESSLDQPPARAGVRTETRRDFDDQVHRVVHFSSGNEWSAGKDALEALRISDDAGLPGRVDHVVVSEKLRLKAIGRLKAYAPSAAAFAFLRVGSIDERREAEDPFSRVWIARLPVEQARILARRAEDMLDIAIPQFRATVIQSEEQREYWRGRINFAFELLSRVTPRLPVDAIHQLIGRAIEYFKDPLFQHVLLQKSFTNLFDRALKALPPLERVRHLVSLASLPLSPVSETILAWPSVMATLQKTQDIPTRESFSSELTVAVSKLLDSLVTADDRGRREAVQRLATLYELGLLTEDEMNLFAERLWTPLRESGLPQKSSFPTTCFGERGGSSADS